MKLGLPVATMRRQANTPRLVEKIDNRIHLPGKGLTGVSAKLPTQLLTLSRFWMHTAEPAKEPPFVR